MPSLKTFRVEFDRPGATYAVGDTVSGNVIVNVSREKNVRGLFFSAKGEARVHWTESRSVKDSNGRDTTEHEHFRNSEEYFLFKYNILGTQKSDSRIQIPVGLQKYPFTFQLPHNIPSSFEHQYGYIRYTVKAVIDRPWKFDHECKAAFTVISPLDLNAFRQKCMGVDDEVMEKFCCFCCFDRGSMNVQIRVPSSGYVPGQSISTTLDYVNLSTSVQMTRICAKLARRLKFHASSPSTQVKTESSEITSTKTAGPFPARGQLTTELLVPPIPPSVLEYCSIIDLDYTLVVSVHVSGPHCRIERSYPLLIGTIPLFSTPSAPPMEEVNPGPRFSSSENLKGPATMAVPMPMPIPMPIPVQPNAPYPTSDVPMGGHNQNQTGATLGFVRPDQPGTSKTNWNLPPPSYEECMSGTHTIKDQDDSNYVLGANDPFAPRYPVFSYPTPNIRDA